MCMYGAQLFELCCIVATVWSARFVYDDSYSDIVYEARPRCFMFVDNYSNHE